MSARGAAVAVLSDYPDRLRASADRVRDAQDRAALAIEHRDRLVIEAVDRGMAEAAVAAHCGLARSTVIRILAHAHRHEDV